MVSRLRSLLFSPPPPGLLPGLVIGLTPQLIGHILLSLGLLTVAWVHFVVARTTIRHLTGQWQICRLWAPPIDPRIQTVQPEMRPPEHGLRRPYQQTVEMIKGLAAAGPSQRLRLEQQLESILNGMDSACRITRFSGAEIWALQSVGTGSAITLAICLLIAAPRGIAGSSRALMTVFITSLFPLGISTTYSSMVDFKQMHWDSYLSYRQLHDIFGELSSSVANAQISAKLVPSGTPIPLNSSGNVATLIRSIDALHEAIPMPLWSFDASFEKSIFNSTIHQK